MSEIALSGGVRQSLAATLTHQAAQADTAVRLATGRKVNTALDAPDAFFTSRSLDARATDLRHLLDGFDTARRRARTAVDGLEDAKDMLELGLSAIDDARRALASGEIPSYRRQTTSVTSFEALPVVRIPQNTATGGGPPTPANEEPASVQAGMSLAQKKARILSSTLFALDNDGAGTVGANAVIYFSVGAGQDGEAAFAMKAAIGGGQTLQQVIDRINTNNTAGDPADDPPFEAFLNDDLKMELRMKTERDNRAIFMTGSSDNTHALRFEQGAYWSGDADVVKTYVGRTDISGDLNDPIPPHSRTSSRDGVGRENVWILDDGFNRFTFDNDDATAGNAASNTAGRTVQDFIDAVNAANDAGTFNFRVDLMPTGEARFTSTGDVTQLLVKPRLSFDWLGIDLGGLSATGPVPDGPTVSPSSPNVENDYYDRFETARTQFDDLISDASYLGRNLLEGDVVTATLNERGSRISTRLEPLHSGDFDLGTFIPVDFNDVDQLDVAEARLREALGSLDRRLTALQAFTATIEVRETFTRDMVNVLRTGSSNLVLADIDEEGANMLASNTRLQLSSNALRLATQADQGVLRLF